MFDAHYKQYVIFRAIYVQQEPLGFTIFFTHMHVKKNTFSKPKTD